MEKQTGKQSFWRIWLLLGLMCCSAGIVMTSYLHAAAQLPSNVGHKLTKEEQAAVIAENSPLTSYVHLSPNATFPRTEPIRKITIHHMADTISLERLGEVFGEEDRRASSNYAVDIDGNIALYVEEKNRSWASSSPENDHQAVTIEVANDEIGGEWHVGDKAYAALIELCVDICRRNGIEELIYTGDETGTLTIHKMFNPNTQCPGPYMTSKMPDIASEVTRRLAEERAAGQQ